MWDGVEEIIVLLLLVQDKSGGGISEEIQQIQILKSKETDERGSKNKNYGELLK